MKQIKIYAIMLALLLPLIQGASIELSLDPEIIQGDTETASISIQSDNSFDGFVYLSFNNLNSITVIPFNNGEFTGTGPFSYEYNWPIYGINTGIYSISANLAYSNGSIIAADELEGIVNSSAPKILSTSPSEFVTTTTTTLMVTTNEDSTCRYSTNNNTYMNNSNTFTLTGSLSHTQIITGLSQGQHTYYARCADSKGNEMNEPEAISFIVDFPPKADISLSDESPIKAGTIEVTVVTSENLDNAPTLYYSFNDAPGSKKIISLTGENSFWRGYMIITSNDDNKVGTFQFSGEDSLGTVGSLIEKGKIFLVDTSNPPAPINIEAKSLPNGNIKLEWYYEGEPIDSFNIYRGTDSGLDYIDFYTSTDNDTQYIDTSVTDKVTYYYKVVAIDKAGNIGPLSEEVYATSIEESSETEENEKEEEEEETKTEEPKVLPPNLVIKVNDIIKKVEQLEIDVKDVSIKFENGEAGEKDIVNELDIMAAINKAKLTINKLKTQLEDLKLEYKTPEQLDSELDKVNLEIIKTRKLTPKQVALIEKAEFIQSTSKEDTEIAVEEIFPGFSKKEKSAYINKNRKIQDDINIEVYIKIINIEYLDESSKEQTIVRKKISYLNPESIEDIIVMEIIPKTFAESTDEINFKSEGYEIIKKDPIVKWGFLKLNFEGKTIEYSTDKKVDMSRAKEIKSVVLVGPIQLEERLNSNVVGYSILPFFNQDSSFTSLEKFFIYLGTIIIIVLCIYYFIFVKGNAPKIQGLKKKIMNFRKKDKKKALFIEEKYPPVTRIKENKENKETPIYSSIVSSFENNVSKKIEKNDDFEHIKEVINQTQEYISVEDFDKAALLYPQVQLLYRGLQKDLKQDIYPQCAELQKNIKDGSQEIYKSIL